MIIGFSRTFPTGDPLLSNVVLLCGFEGTDGSTTMTDESPAAHGNASVSASAQDSTSQAYFGNSSLKLVSATSDHISWPDSDDWAFGTGPFTVEFFFRPNRITGVQFLMAQWGASGTHAWRIWMNNSFGVWNVSTNGTDDWQDLSVSGITANVWHHLAVDYDGLKYRMYLDGVRQTFATTGRNIFNASSLLTIGSDGTGANTFDGFIDEVRISRTARYASDTGFTVPASTFPRTTGTFVYEAAITLGATVAQQADRSGPETYEAAVAFRAGMGQLFAHDGSSIFDNAITLGAGVKLAPDTGVSLDGVKFWFNGVPTGMKRGAAPVAGVKYWFNGVIAPTGLN